MAKDTASKDSNVKPIERAKETVSETKEKARESLETAREKLHDVAGEVSKRYEKLSADVRRGAERASEVARERYAQTSDAVRRGYERVRKDAGDLSEDVTTYVRDNPGKAVLIAAGVGFLLGLLLAPRGRRYEED